MPSFLPSSRHPGNLLGLFFLFSSMSVSLVSSFICAGGWVQSQHHRQTGFNLCDLYSVYYDVSDMCFLWMWSFSSVYNNAHHNMLVDYRFDVHSCFVLFFQVLPTMKESEAGEGQWLPGKGGVRVHVKGPDDGRSRTRSWSQESGGLV